MRDFKLRRRFNKLVKDGGAGGGSGGAGGGVMRVGNNGNAMDKTWQEISDCFANGGYAYIAMSPAPGIAFVMPIVAVGYEKATYTVAALSTLEGVALVQFTCSSPDEYPVFADDANT